MTMILAKIFGLYFLAIGIAFLINPNRFKEVFQQMMKDDGLLLLGGILALFIGAVVIAVHNEWVLNWPVIITLLGWWSLIKGFGLLISSGFIKLFSFLENRSSQFFRMLSFIYLVLGSFLIWKGFW